MGQKHTKHNRQVWPREKGRISTSEAWGQTSKDHFRQSLAEIVAEFGLQVPYEPSDSSQHWSSCQDQKGNIYSQKNAIEEMTYSLPAEIPSVGDTICNAVREKIFRLKSSLQHVTFVRQDNRMHPLTVTDGHNNRLSVEHLESLEV